MEAIAPSAHPRIPPRLQDRASYFRSYLARAPIAHAIWRTREAFAMDGAPYEPPLLDLGCGFGEFAGVFFNSSVEVGLDISHPDLSLAANTGKYESVMLGDAHKLPLPDAFVRTVISVSVLEHIPDLEPVFAEVARVLEPGGTFVYTVPTREFDRELLPFRFFSALRLASLARASSRAYNRVFRHVSVLDLEGWTQLAEQAGLEVTHVSGTLSRRALRTFQWCLPLAVPSQVMKATTGRRPRAMPGWLRDWLHDRLY